MQNVLITSDGRTFKARYDNGIVFSSRISEDETIVWEVCFAVESPPQRITNSIRRAMTNHGTYAAIHGGRLVVISSAE